jgi:hypothetical protein
MSETESTSTPGVSKTTTLLIVLLTNVVSLGMAYLVSGEAPEPAAVTCDIASEVAASPACSQDEAAIEAEEEAAEDSTPE